MKFNKFCSILIILVAIITLLAPVPTFALSSDDIFLMPFDKPVLDDDDLLIYTLQKNSNGGKYVHAFYLPVDIFVNGEPGSKPNKEHITNSINLYSTYFNHYATSYTNATLYCNPIRYSNTGNYYDMDLISGTNSFNYQHNIAGTLVGYQIYGDADKVSLNGNASFSSSDYDFTVLWGGDAAIYELMLQTFNLTNDEKIELGKILSKLGEIDSNTDNLESYIKDVYNKLVEVDTNTENCYRVLGYLHTLIGYIDDNVVIIKDDLKKVYSAVDELESKIDELIDIFESQGSSNPNESLDHSTTDEYNSIEDSLIDDDVSDDMTNIKINYSSNALAVVFDIMDSIVNVNQKIFTMFISILSVSIIALILGR